MPTDQPLCRLRFPLAGVRSLIDQAKRLAKDRVLWVSGDEGAYLTCEQWASHSSQVVYADGFNPKTDPEFRKRLEEIFGDETFEEALPLKDIEASIAVFPEAATFIMEVYPEEIEFVLSGPKGVNGQVRNGIRLIR